IRLRTSRTPSTLEAISPAAVLASSEGAVPRSSAMPSLTSTFTRGMSAVRGSSPRLVRIRCSTSSCCSGTPSMSPLCCSPMSGPEDGSEYSRSAPVRLGPSGRWRVPPPAVPVGVPLPHVSPRWPAGLPASGECWPVVPVNEDEAPPLPERETRAPMARPARAKNPYLRKRSPLGSRELAAWRTSLAWPLPSFHAVFPAALPTLGATRAPAIAPTLAPFRFLLAIHYLHIGGAGFAIQIP